MTVKEHYDQHLAHFYAWMSGDFEARSNEFRKFLTEQAIVPNASKIAVDLGAGHGIQSIPLAEQGFNVVAVDFSEQLLTELRSNAKNLSITPVHGDIRKIKQLSEQPELIVCCGDTLPHLESKQEIEQLISDMAGALNDHGKVILSFRDYSIPLSGTDRFIPVRSDENKILTCILDYENDFVNVTDLLYGKINGSWQQKVSTYKKVRLTTEDVINFLTKAGLTIIFNQVVNRLVTIIACK